MAAGIHILTQLSITVPQLHLSARMVLYPDQPSFLIIFIKQLSSIGSLYSDQLPFSIIKVGILVSPLVTLTLQPSFRIKGILLP